MPRRNPFVNVTAVVSPAMAEELDRLAAAKKVSRSNMVRQLLEERLTQRANERMESEYERLEKRLQRIENRFSALIVKGARASAQDLYLSMRYLEFFTELSKEDMQDWWQKSRQYAGKWLQSAEKNETMEGEPEDKQ